MLKIIIRLLLITGLVLLLPIIASRFVDGWGWSFLDYVFIGIMVFGIGSLFEIGRSMSQNIMYRAGFALALLSGFAIIVGNGAVGFIGSEDNPINLIYIVVILIGFLSAIAVRFRPLAMSRIMYGVAFGVALVPVIALITNSTFQEIPKAAGTAYVFMLNTFFVAAFIAAGLLFRNASMDESEKKLSHQNF